MKENTYRTLFTITKEPKSSHSGDSQGFHKLKLEVDHTVSKQEIYQQMKDLFKPDSINTLMITESIDDFYMNCREPWTPQLFNNISKLMKKKGLTMKDSIELITIDELKLIKGCGKVQIALFKKLRNL